jgi:large subunit ribosomal protein L24
MKKIKVNDEVIVIAGKDKSKIGVITKVLDGKVVVEGVNIAKKHVRPNPNAGVTGGIIDTEMPLAISNVALLNATTQKADRVGLRVNDKGVKERFFKSSGEAIA